jgi:hypothetical protein
MKAIKTLLLYLGIVLLGILILNSIELSKENKRLSRELKKASIRDSLYWVHISKCSFISNDQIQVGYDNYLQLIDSSKPIN